MAEPGARLRVAPDAPRRFDAVYSALGVTPRTDLAAQAGALGGVAVVPANS